MGRAASNKAKGRNGQQEVAKALLELSNTLQHTAWLTEDDFRSNPMGAPGADILLSSQARRLFPWNIEIKRSKKSTVEGWMEQARGHGKYKPIVFSRQDHKEWNVTVDMDYFFHLYSLALEEKKIADIIDSTTVQLIPTEKGIKTGKKVIKEYSEALQELAKK